ncbi:MAG: hypothetical protein ABSB50_00090 [Terracidiphilus sp.]
MTGIGCSQKLPLAERRNHASLAALQRNTAPSEPSPSAVSALAGRIRPGLHRRGMAPGTQIPSPGGPAVRSFSERIEGSTLAAPRYRPPPPLRAE